MQDIVNGYEKAFAYIQKNIDALKTPKLNPEKEEDLQQLIKSSICSKNYSNE